MENGLSTPNFINADTNEKQQIVDWDRQHVWHHLTQHATLEKHDPLVMSHGEGIHVWDINGKQYLDASSGGVWCVNVGYGRERIANVIRDQALKLNFFAGTAGTPVLAAFANKLIEKMPGMSRVYLSNSGSEANEKAYKIVRQIAHQKYGGKKHKILYRERDYHGTTITCLSSTGQEERRKQYGPFTPGFVEFPHCCEYRSQFGDIDDYGVKAAQQLESVILQEGPDTVGAIVIEPITAGGGVITPPPGYYDEVQRICRQYDILIHVDEVVCGLGRTGKWFGYQHYGLKPDIVTMAKGVASAYAAISCTVTTEAIFDCFKQAPDDKYNAFRDISTFGGCTIGPAAALENIKIIEEENLVQNAALIGEYLFAQLKQLKRKYPIIGDVRGQGLFLGMELVKDQQTKQPVHESTLVKFAALCMSKGLIIGRTNRSFETFNNTLCLSPPLTISSKEADDIITILDEAFSEL
ncbi:taurine--pyruvate aminotransferase [Vibrio sp. 10N.286.49.C2]|uniref:aminotransferase family protein n=1 Tax=unclassified Vibrio TaxID=2614977 RepID=UPI000C863756|nr:MULTISPECIES: aminotransferase class III-fold pyridoxal phosphate-dependent enzyme [unclassified Vibrio]PMH38111.1 taurine--pyruvate aminotransferase [Vibrio sp. 10N.286.49.C2]PMH53683.1 taurine--pyruvate aminotransferase [Vibrio sp. 10N.286.49.B1]PMH81953.1 taurine--pyruvate aminotransferase [Vibrio sp. 10N.286.48.B7]